MAEGKGADLLAQLLGELQQAGEKAERLLTERSPEERERIACGPGCGSCCVLNVSALFPEGLAVYHYLQLFPVHKREKITGRLESLWSEVRGLDDEERMVVRRKCAFLDERGSCSIYPVRPLLCRSVTSTAPSACRDALTGVLLGAETAILMNEYQQQLYESLFIGLGEDLVARGLDGRSFQLSGLVRLLLNHPDVEDQLLAGRRLDWLDLY